MAGPYRGLYLLGNKPCSWVGAASNNCQDQLSFASSSQRHESAERASRELFVVMTGVI